MLPSYIDTCGFCIFVTYAAVMSKRCKVIKPDGECQSSSDEPDSINWELCFLCQEEKDDHLQCPINVKGRKCGYIYFAGI